MRYAQEVDFKHLTNNFLQKETSDKQENKKWWLDEVADVSTNLIIAIISQCTCISKCDIVHFKHIQFYV